MSVERIIKLNKENCSPGSSQNSQLALSDWIDYGKLKNSKVHAITGSQNVPNIVIEEFRRWISSWGVIQALLSIFCKHTYTLKLSLLAKLAECSTLISNVFQMCFKLHNRLLRILIWIITHLSFEFFASKATPTYLPLFFVEHVPCYFLKFFKENGNRLEQNEVFGHQISSAARIYALYA